MTKMDAHNGELTTRQLQALPRILAGRTYEEGCKKAKIAKQTFYTWMHDDTFRAEFERQRDLLADAAFNVLTQNVEKAVGVLTELLGAEDDRLRRWAAKDLLAFYLKHREYAQLEQRLVEMEERLLTSR